MIQNLLFKWTVIVVCFVFVYGLMKEVENLPRTTKRDIAALVTLILFLLGGAALTWLIMP